MEGGEEFLRIWDVTTAIVGIYGLARLVIASPKILRNLGKAWKNFKGKQQLKKQGFAEQAVSDRIVEAPFKQNTQNSKLEKVELGSNVKKEKIKTKGSPEEQLSDIGKFDPVGLTKKELVNIIEWSNIRNSYLKNGYFVDTPFNRTV